MSNLVLMGVLCFDVFAVLVSKVDFCIYKVDFCIYGLFRWPLYFWFPKV